MHTLDLTLPVRESIAIKVNMKVPPCINIKQDATLMIIIFGELERARLYTYVRYKANCAVYFFYVRIIIRSRESLLPQSSVNCSPPEYEHAILQTPKS